MDIVEITPCKQLHLLLIAGSLRQGSVNVAVLRTVQAMAPQHVNCTLYQRLQELPHFNPDDDRAPLPEAVAELRGLMARSHAILFSTPEYAGSLPGAFKNLLDWSVGGGIHGVRVGWINASAMGGAQRTYETLGVVLGYANADIIEAACLNVPVPRSAIGEDGLIADPRIRDVIARGLGSLIGSESEPRHLRDWAPC
ncbi:MAG TPA: NADPH-dependent FMN reductase [Polyangiaceae bacterium]